MKAFNIRPDEVDANSLDALERSRGWQLIVVKMAEMRTSAMSHLLTAEDWEATARAQAEARILDRVLELPKIIRAEIRKRGK